MDCSDVRERLRALLRGRATLTDYALMEAHLTRCAACRQELEKAQRSVIRHRRRPARISRRLKVAGGAALTLVLGLALAAYLVYRLPKLQPFLRGPSGTVQSVAPSGAPPPRQPAPAPDEPRASITAPQPGELTPTLPPRAPSPRPTVTPVPSAQISERVPSSADVLIRLTVSDRGEAERRLTGLLEGVEATGLDSRSRGDAREVVAAIPQPNYPKFTVGLAQIGAWRVESRRRSLPDMVRIRVRVIERSG